MGASGTRGVQGPTGPQGEQGETGPAGIADTITIGTVITGEPGTEASITDIGGSPNHVLNFVIPRGIDGNSNDFCCFCVQQMRNIIEQIITLYPDNELFITLDGGDAIVGTPGEIRLGPNGEAGVFEVLSQGAFRQYLTICSIDTITINNATYNDRITYLPMPVPMPTGCCFDCDSTIRDILTVGTNDVSIITNTQLTSQGDVIRNEPGMIVLENPESNNITFVSSCRIDVAYLT